MLAKNAKSRLGGVPTGSGGQVYIYISQLADPQPFTQIIKFQQSAQNRSLVGIGGLDEQFSHGQNSWILHLHHCTYVQYLFQD